MNIIQHLQQLDALIVENTTPPATAKLRNYISTIMEQAETEVDLPEAMAKLKRDTQKEILRITKLYATGKGLLPPSDVIEQWKKEIADA